MAFCSPANCKLKGLHIPSTTKTLTGTIYGPTTSRTGGSRRRGGGAPLIVAMTSASSDVAPSGGGMPVYDEGQLDRPRWTGETPLSRLVGALIAFKPLFSVLKPGARQVLISTAEKTNIPWREMTSAILESEVYKEIESIQNPSLVYPDYYLNPFHAYDEGNLSWLPNKEVSIGPFLCPNMDSKIQRHRAVAPSAAAATAQSAAVSLSIGSFSRTIHPYEEH